MALKSTFRRPSGERAAATVALCVAAAALLSAIAFAQSPPGKIESAPPPQKPQQGERPLRVDVNLVLVPVTVTDPYGRLVTGLERENFRIYEDGVEREVLTVSTEEVPISVGLVFDMSGSMSVQIGTARMAAMQFFRTANPQDEFLMVVFSSRAQLVSDFTSSLEPLKTRVYYVKAGGLTALFDALYLGLSRMNEAHHTRRAIIIISDGEDNHSRYTEKDVLNFVKEADVQLYAVGGFGSQGWFILNRLTELTGGRMFGGGSLEETSSRIWAELRNQYVLSYSPGHTNHDGKWHKIKVKLHPPRGLPPLEVHARAGYRAPG